MTFDLRITRPGASSVSIKDYAYIENWDGVWSGAPFRGGDVIIPGQRGQLFAAQDYDAYTFSVPLQVIGTSQTDFQEKLSSLRALIDSTQSVVSVNRKLPRTSGDLTTSCTARCRLSEMGARNGLFAARVALEVTNLDGCWFAATESFTHSGSSSHTILGDIPTNYITLDFTTTGTLTNSTTGTAIQVATGGPTLNARFQTSTGNLGDLTITPDVFGSWMVFAAGSNSLALTGGGSVDVTYRPAYA
jgi:hypothetical protein